MKEADVQRMILQYLAIKKIWCARRNSGAYSFQRQDGSRGYVKAGEPGMADIEAWTRGGQTVWIEVKAPKGAQTEAQREFQKKAEKHGHIYVVARSIDDLFPLFGGL